MDAYKINDCEIYAAYTAKEAIDIYVAETGERWDTDDNSVELMSPEDQWRDEETPDVEETIADVLARTTNPGFLGAIG